MSELEILQNNLKKAEEWGNESIIFLCKSAIKAYSENPNTPDLPIQQTTQVCELDENGKCSNCES